MKAPEKIKLKVNGQNVMVPVKTLKIVSIDKAMRQISSKIAHWGSVLADAERERDMANAFYRQWRARQGKELLDANPKMSEWKINQELNSDSKFIALKEAIADAEFNVSVLARFYEALNKQAFSLPSIGARKRKEVESMGITTKKRK